MESRMEAGMNMIREYAGEAGIGSVEAIRALHPEMYRYVVEFGFGDIYATDGLPLGQKAAVTIASLVTLGDTAGQLAFHMRAALHSGLPAKELYGILLHCVPYAGFPRVLNAFQIAKSILDERDAGGRAASASG